MNMAKLTGIVIRAAAVSGLIIGCATTTVRSSWSKPGASPEEFERINALCEQDRGMTGLKGDSGYDVCMQQHGWLLIREPAP